MLVSAGGGLSCISFLILGFPQAQRYGGDLVRTVLASLRMTTRAFRRVGVPFFWTANPSSKAKSLPQVALDRTTASELVHHSWQVSLIVCPLLLAQGSVNAWSIAETYCWISFQTAFTCGLASSTPYVTNASRFTRHPSSAGMYPWPACFFLGFS